MDPANIQESVKAFFPGLLGVRFLETDRDRVRATLEVRPELCTVPGILHGGAVMAFADTLGGVATFLNLPDGAATTTIESKTNFLAAGREGTAVVGECTPLHRGRRTMVWQTRVTSPDGKLLALVTQTQAVLERQPEPVEAMTTLFAGKGAAEQKKLLELLERAGAGLYRALAGQERDPAAREALLANAAREEANADALRTMEGS
ncbi:MAG: PaaI family thioesterase [Candidatus Binatia bacterium]